MEFVIQAFNTCMGWVSTNYGGNTRDEAFQAEAAIISKDSIWMPGKRETRIICYQNGIAIGGHRGMHDWALGKSCEDGIPVFVDDRQLAYRKTAETAMSYAMEIIERLQADGDYRLNDRPAGFLPPTLAPAEWVQMEELSKCPQCGGEADRGVDSCIPPSAYMCSKCCAQEEAEKASIPPAGFALVYEGLRQDGDMRWSKFDQRWTLVYSENMSKRIEDFDFPCARRSSK